MVSGEVDASNTQMWKNGVLRDTDSLSGYSIKPANTNTPVRLGTRDMSTGFLIGRLRRVAFFDRKLSAAELKTLYDANAMAEGSGGTTPAPAPSAAPTTAPTTAPTSAPTTAPPTAPRATPTTAPTATPTPASTDTPPFYVVPVSGQVKVGRATKLVAGTNIRRAANALVLYTPARGTNTKTNHWGAEATVVNGKVTAFVNRTSSGAEAATIPPNGFVLSGHGTARDWLVANAKVGSTVS
jgi:hypothetical protein